MKVTNRTKKDFETWYLKTFHKSDKGHDLSEYWLWLFNELNESQRFGVFIDFFDANDIEGFVDNISEYDTEKCYSFYFTGIKKRYPEYLTRSLARRALIRESNKLYNKK